MALDLTFFSLHRINGHELPTLPGLMTFAPPRKPARGRERESLIVSILLSGNTPFSDEDYQQLTHGAAAAFYNSPGALTTALRTAADAVNRNLLDRNLSTTGRGQYVIGALLLAALRDTQLIILQSGPTHMLAVQAGQAHHFHDPALSGKGMGLHANFGQYFSQLSLQPGDRLVFASKIPSAWESALVIDRGLQPPETLRKRLLASVDGDVSATFLQVTEGKGALTLVHSTGTPAPRLHEGKKPAPPTVAPILPQPSPAPLATPPAPAEAAPRVPAAPAVVPPPANEPGDEPQSEEKIPAHMLGRPPENQPSAYAIPPAPTTPEDDEALVEQLAEMALAHELPPSIPRIQPLEPEPAPAAVKETPITVKPKRTEPRVPSEGARRAAQVAVNAIQAWRSASERFGVWLRKVLPRLLPGGESDAPITMSGTLQTFIAIAVPVLVAVVAFVVYSSLGRTAQFETLLSQAEALHAQAIKETDPTRQREAWSNVLQRVEQAEVLGGPTAKTSALRQEAQTRLDALLGVTRLNFNPAFATALDADVSRMAANETDLYMLDAAQGMILRAALTGRGYELDSTFDCKPGQHGEYTTSPMIDLLILPKLNTLNSSVMGVDAAGNLLYCSPGQVAQATQLTRPPTNWGRVTAITLDGNKLYVLDAPSRAVWVYNGKDSTFPDPPYFYFGSQIPDIQDAIDISASGDELYMLHADGRLTHCTYSRVETAPTRCDSPVPLTNPFPAYGEINAFGQAHFTQMALTALPDAAVLLLDADGRMVYRISLRTFELQGIYGQSGGAINLSAGPFTAMTVSPNHVLYLARGDQVFVSNDAP